MTPPAGHTGLIPPKKVRKKTSGSEKVRIKQKRSDEGWKKLRMTSKKDALILYREEIIAFLGSIFGCLVGFVALLEGLERRKLVQVPPLVHI